MLEILVVLIVVGALLYLVQLLPLDATIQQVIRVVVILLVILYVIQMLFGIGVPGVRMRL